MKCWQQSVVKNSMENSPMNKQMGIDGGLSEIPKEDECRMVQLRSKRMIQNRVMPGMEHVRANSEERKKRMGFYRRKLGALKKSGKRTQDRAEDTAGSLRELKEHVESLDDDTILHVDIDESTAEYEPDGEALF
jgi:hypothetical protein